MTTQKQLIEALKHEATTNTTSNAVLHMWALRERARHEVTIHGLSCRMKKEGFTHDKKDYEPLLRRMADLGVGKLKVDGKGRIVALVEVKTTLQSIGKAVCGNQFKALEPYKSKNRYVSVPKPVPNNIEKLYPAQKVLVSTPTSVSQEPLRLTFTLNTHPVTVSIPSDLSNDDVSQLIGRLRAQG